MRKLFLLLLVVFAVFVFINSNTPVGAEKANDVEAAGQPLIEP